MVKESPEQLALEAEIKEQAIKFITYLNSTLPESMELEYEGFYRRGFFVSKKRYAVIEDGEIIAKGLELVRRDWAPIVKKTQEEVLMAIQQKFHLMSLQSNEILNMLNYIYSHSGYLILSWKTPAYTCLKAIMIFSTSSKERPELIS